MDEPIDLGQLEEEDAAEETAAELDPRTQDAGGEWTRRFPDAGAKGWG